MVFHFKGPFQAFPASTRAVHLTISNHTSAAQGQPVLDNNRPFDAFDANHHGPDNPNLNDAARAATAIASTASPTPDPVGESAPNTGSRP